MALRVPRWLNACWRGTHLCAQGCWAIGLWTLWLLLGVLLVFQLVIVVSREMPIPGFLLRRAEERLAAAGLKATFGHAAFDPTGHVLVRDLRILSGPTDEPIITAETALVEIDPWALIIRELSVQRLELSGGSLWVPAMLSPSGRAEPWTQHIELQLSPAANGRELELHQLTARVAQVSVTAHGTLSLPPRPRDAPRRDWARLLAEAYPRLSRRIAQELSRHRDTAGQLFIQVDGTDMNAQLTVPTWELTPGLIRGGDGVQVDAAAIETHLAFDPSWSLSRWEARLAARRVSRGEDAIEHVRIQAGHTLHGENPWHAGEVEATASAVRVRDVELQQVRVSADLEQWPALTASVTAQGWDGRWAFAGNADAHTRELSGRFAGTITPALLDWGSPRAARNLAELLRVQTPPKVSGEIEVSGQRLTQAAVRLDSGPVHARGVDLERAKGLIRWDGQRLEVEDILLRIGESSAIGSYEMDAASRDFRFLLHGKLQPLAIQGWFREWWPRFWSRFDFPAEAPAADVDIRGRWRHPEQTVVFVVADGAQVRLQGADFDRVRTRLVVRPQIADILEFIGDRSGRSARGRFTRFADAAGRDWTGWRFAVSGDTDLEPGPAIFGALGQSIVEPFSFTTPPRLEVEGEVQRDDPAAETRSSVRIAGSAAGDWAFYGFPLHDLFFRAELTNDLLLVNDLDVGFAGGRGQGKVELRGLNRERRLAFDLALNRARLGESIRTLETWSARRRGEEPAPVSQFQQRIAAGTLDLSLTAEGTYDDPYSLMGTGNAVISGAELGEINLLGILSSLLRRTVFNFTTLQLDSAQGNFVLLGPLLDFEQLRVSGPRSAIDASGQYRLDNKALSFVAKVRPFDASDSFLGSAAGFVFSPLSHALEVRLTGQLAEPDWAFVYGPTSLFRALAGESARPPLATPAPAPRPPLKKPQ